MIGPNGAGKTTFINCICGSYQPSTGSVRWKDKELLGLSPNMLLRLGISRTFQNVASLHDLTVMDLVKLGAGMSRQRPGFRGRFGASKALERELTETLLSPLGLESYAHQPIQTLPYGRRKATDLARALAANPKLLLLDEPVAGLTTQEAMAMAGVISESSRAARVRRDDGRAQDGRCIEHLRPHCGHGGGQQNLRGVRHRSAVGCGSSTRLFG